MVKAAAAKEQGAVAERTATKAASKTGEVRAKVLGQWAPQISTARPRPNPLNREPLAILPFVTALVQAAVQDQVLAKSCGEAKRE